MTFDRAYDVRTASYSEPSGSSEDSRVSNQVLQETDKGKQQPSILRGSFTQIMVNLMQLQDHEFTASLNRLVEAKKTGRINNNTRIECIVNPTMKSSSWVINGTNRNLETEKNLPKNWK